MIKPYPYQEEAIRLMEGKAGFILADDMGLGKTVTALVEIQRADIPEPKILVIAPKSARSVWEDHVREILPEHDTYLLDTTNAPDMMMKYDHGIIITHWDVLRLVPALAHKAWDFVVADEAHYAKNRKAQRTKALKKVKATYKRALTGTPMVNRPDELWSILSWVAPRKYTSYWRFFEAYCHYEQHPVFGYKIFIGPKNIPGLKRELVGLVIRRKKEEVLPDLPEKYYTPIEVDLHPKQRRAYEEMKKEMLAWVKTQEDEDYPLKAPTVLAQLTRLRQFAAAHAEINHRGDVVLSEPSAKLDAMMELVQDTDRPVVIFTQFRGLLNLALARLEEAGEEVVVMHGGIGQQGRADSIKRFQDGKARIFLATVQTGGVGITLTAASTVIFLDRTWSPAINVQGEDRLHRIGQKSAVQVITLPAKDTVDQVVEEKLELKWQWIRGILE